MKIAIVNQGRFAIRWIKYCENKNIPYKIVNPYDSDIVKQIEDCTAFMWHHYHNDYRDVLFAKQLLYSLEQKGINVFPNFKTTWHFDDKIGQKYLFEAIGAPMVPSYVFYSKNEALKWINNTSFPKVFKLRGGAGSINVKLAKNKIQAIKFVNKAFGKGFPHLDRLSHLKERFKKFKAGTVSLLGLVKETGRLFFPNKNTKLHSREKGYVFFQDFIPDNNFDIRIVVVGNKAFALKRLVRNEDFRASGSGVILYNKNQIDERCVKIAFDVNEKIDSQSIAYDFIFNENNNPLIVEISYGYAADAYDKCEGYWDRNLNWYEGTNFDFCGWMVEQVM